MCTKWCIIPLGNQGQTQERFLTPKKKLSERDFSTLFLDTKFTTSYV